MFPAAAADDQHGLSQKVFQVDFLGTLGRFNGREGVYKAHILLMLKMTDTRK